MSIFSGRVCFCKRDGLPGNHHWCSLTYCIGVWCCHVVLSRFSWRVVSVMVCVCVENVRTTSVSCLCVCVSVCKCVCLCWGVSQNVRNWVCVCVGDVYGFVCVSRNLYDLVLNYCRQRLFWSCLMIFSCSIMTDYDWLCTNVTWSWFITGSNYSCPECWPSHDFLFACQETCGIDLLETANVLVLSDDLLIYAKLRKQKRDGLRTNHHWYSLT